MKKTVAHQQRAIQEAASRIAQLQIGHIPLNSHLYKFKRADKTNCLACGEDYETPLHFLLSCPIYAFEHWALERQVKKKKKSLSLETLLGDPDLALLLANYIDGTNQFKQALGEQQHMQNGDTSQDSSQTTMLRDTRPATTQHYNYPCNIHTPACALVDVDKETQCFDDT